MASAPAFAAREEQTLYDARCDNCGKDTKVVFAPDGKRKVYCKSCRKKLQRQKEQAHPTSPAQSLDGRAQQSPSKEQQQVSLKEAMQKEPTMFHPLKRAQEGKNQKRKEVDKQGLKEALGAALKEATPQKKTQKGERYPGQTLHFS